MSRIDIDFSHLRLESGARIEEHAPAEADDLAGGSRGQDHIFALKAGRRRSGNVVLDLVAGQLRMVKVPLLIEHELAKQRPHQVKIGRVERLDFDVGRAATLSYLPPDGTPSSTPRSACAAPNRPAVSTGTTSFAFSLAANFESVSSWRIDTSVESGFASVIA